MPDPRSPLTHAKRQEPAASPDSLEGGRFLGRHVIALLIVLTLGHLIAGLLSDTYANVMGGLPAAVFLAVRRVLAGSQLQGTTALAELAEWARWFYYGEVALLLAAVGLAISVRGRRRRMPPRQRG